MNSTLPTRSAPPQRGRALLGWLMAGSCLTAAPALAAAPARPAAAQPAEPALQEVVVTARKKSELLQDVPLAVTAVTAQTLQRANVQSFSDIAKLSPGFFNQPVASGRNDRLVTNFVIRGLNLTSFTGAADAVLLFVDGAPVVSGDLSGFDDVERVEVLRGPQSAYFGRNAFAGAINVVTKDPSFEWGGRVTGEWANHETSAVTGEVQGPIVADKLAFRLSGHYRDQGGFYKNPAGGVLGERKTEGVSLTLLARPVEGLRVKLFGEYAHDHDGPAASAKFEGDQLTCPQKVQNWICGDVGDFPLQYVGANTEIYPGFRENIMNKVTMFDHPFIHDGGLVRRSYSAHAIINYELPGGMSLSSTTAYHNSQSELISDEDQRDTRAIPNPAYGKVPNMESYYNLLFFVERKFTDFSQEVRLTSNQDQRLRWSLGGNYVRVEGVSSNVAGAVPFFAGFFSKTPPVKVSTPSVFGAVYFDVTKAITASVEAREQWDKVTNYPGGGVALGATFKSFSPRITLQYHPDETTNLFVDWARGYRPGTFNARFLTLSPSAVAELQAQTGAGLTVDPEQLDEAEIGLKKRLLHNRLSFSLVGYYGVLKNEQVQNLAHYTGPNNVPITLAVITNLGKTNIYGVEFEGAISVTRDLTVNASWAWNETNIRSYYCLACAGITGDPNVVGNHLPGVPRFTGSLYAMYTHPLSGDYDWFVRPEYFYTGSSYATEANIASSGARNEVNLRAGVQSSQIRFEAYVTNLFNDKTPLSIAKTFDGFNTSKAAIGVGLPPLREVGVRVAYTF